MSIKLSCLFFQCIFSASRLLKIITSENRISHCDLLAFSLVVQINHKDVHVTSNTYLKCSLNTEMQWWNGAESIKVSYSSCCLASCWVFQHIGKRKLGSWFTKDRDTSKVIVKHFSCRAQLVLNIVSSLPCNFKPISSQDSFPLKKH